MLDILKRAIPFVMALGIFVGGYNLGYNKADNNWKEVVNREYIEKQVATERVQQEVSRISRDYQDTIAEIEGSTDRVIDDLRNDNKRLRVRIKTSARPSESDSGCFPDGKAELDDSTAKRLIGITKRGDAQIEALIDTVKALQQENERLTKGGN